MGGELEFMTQLLHMKFNVIGNLMQCEWVYDTA